MRRSCKVHVERSLLTQELKPGPSRSEVTVLTTVAPHRTSGWLFERDTIWLPYATKGDAYLLYNVAPKKLARRAVRAQADRLMKRRVEES